MALALHNKPINLRGAMLHLTGSAINDSGGNALELILNYTQMKLLINLVAEPTVHVTELLAFTTTEEANVHKYVGEGLVILHYCQLAEPHCTHPTRCIEILEKLNRTKPIYIAIRPYNQGSLHAFLSCGFEEFKRNEEAVFLCRSPRV